MTILELSKVAEKFYNSRCPENIVTGYPKKVLTDGKESIFVSTVNGGDLSRGEAIFYIRRLNGETITEEKVNY